MELEQVTLCEAELKQRRGYVIISTVETCYGNRKNNNPNNLMVFSSASDHQKYHNYFRKKVS